MRPQSRISAQIRRIKKKDVLASDSGRSAKGKSSYALDDDELPTPLDTERAEHEWLDWFERNGRKPFRFQVDAWQAFRRGDSGVISVPTGSGKTLAAFGGPFMSLLERPTSELSIVYVAPLKALARDVTEALKAPVRELELPFHVELRTGDTTQEVRSKIREAPPQILVITPESLALMMTSNTWVKTFSSLRSVIVDEWHVLMGTKRGCLLELSLSRLRSVAPEMRTWALSATLPNLEEAARHIIGHNDDPVLIRQSFDRAIDVTSLIPPRLSAFPWFGHSGLSQLGSVVDSIDPKRSTLLFTNTRNQAERWYQGIRDLKPEWSRKMALHHGSLDRGERERVESGIKSGDLKLVVATASLDLGVDFPQVERVIQIGSVKGYDRAIQRAGRAYHRPGQETSISICPTHLFEILEISALREGLKSSEIEARLPLVNPLDVLVQFVLNSAFADGFDADELFANCRSTQTFRTLTRDQFSWAIDFATTGGRSFQAYPQYRKLELQEGRYRFASPKLARQHRLNMGTIISEAGVLVRFPRREKLGMIDESFVSKLHPGDTFVFSGKSLQLVQLRDMVALVRLSRAKEAKVPVWSGTSYPISSSLARFLRREIEKLAEPTLTATATANRQDLSMELQAFLPVAQAQARVSAVPRTNEVLVEVWSSREGQHFFIYAFEGKLIHEGLGHLAASRLAKAKANTISIASSDYGIDLLAAEPMTIDAGLEDMLRDALSDVSSLEDDIEESMNFPSLAKAMFREIARVSGLLQQSPPGKAKTTRHLQMSSSLLFDVLMRYEPDNPLLLQAYEEVMYRQLDLVRLRSVMSSLNRKKWIIRHVEKPTPFSFPLLIERMSSQVSTETLTDRIRRMQKQLEVTK